MRDSDRLPDSNTGPTTAHENTAAKHNGPEFRCPHGKEPHQQNLGQHPAEGYIGYVDDPEDAEWFQLHERDATAQQLIHEVIEIEEHAVVDRGEMQ